MRRSADLGDLRSALERLEVGRGRPAPASSAASVGRRSRGGRQVQRDRVAGRHRLVAPDHDDARGTAPPGRRRVSGSTRGRPVITPRRNQRGPSTPTNRAGCTAWLPSAARTGTRVAQLGAERALDLVGGAALLGDAGGDLGAHLVPDALAARGGERLHLQRAARRAPASRRRPRRSVWSASMRTSSPRPAGQPAGHRGRPGRRAAGSSTSAASHGPVGRAGGAGRPAPSSVGALLVDRPRARRRRARRRVDGRRLLGVVVLAALLAEHVHTSVVVWGSCRSVLVSGGVRSRRWSRARPSPRAEPGSRSTSWNRACSTRCTTSWAIRSPRRSRTVAGGSWLTSSTLISPRYPASTVPGRVHHADAEPVRQPRARVHERGVPVRQRDRHAGRHHGALARRQLDVLGGRPGRRRRRRDGRTPAAAGPGRAGGPARRPGRQRPQSPNCPPRRHGGRPYPAGSRPSAEQGALHQADRQPARTCGQVVEVRAASRGPRRASAAASGRSPAHP